ncbi:MAG TPA: NPCBM/NEW2 domain-containing protein, partial [Candidatus Acidoferrales bacterium]|nr:NPCBM/NEW2 domain-containing protein [Candidatus Acidoferrales bacterium]
LAPANRLAALASDPRRAVRLAAVLALRRMRSEDVARFLGDADPQIASEAARAAYDLGLPGAMAQLAATLPALRADLRLEAYQRRAIEAALRVGGAGQAEQLAAYAADPATAEPWRDLALHALAQWDQPEARDGVWGALAPVAARPAGLAHAPIAAHLGDVLAHARGTDLATALALAQREGVVVGNSRMLGWVEDEDIADAPRVYALRWLSARGAPEAAEALRAALGSRRDSVFVAGLQIALAQDPYRALAVAERAVADSSLPLGVRQAAIGTVGSRHDAASAGFLVARLAELRRGTLDPRLRLDALEAARASHAPSLAAPVRAEDAALRAGDPLGSLTLALQGGDATRGRSVFAEHPAAQCMRCHTIDGAGATTGPDLSLVGAHDRRYLLESLVRPSAVIAPGYETTTLTLAGGHEVTGLVKAETADSITLRDGDSLRTFPRARVLHRTRGASLMPPMSGLLSPFELRDVIEYLASRREVEPDVPLPPVPAALASATHVDRSWGGAPLRVGGRVVAHGLGVQSPWRLEVPAPPGMHAFVARVGLDDEAPGGLVGFEVRVDGRTAWKSPPMRRGQIARAWAALPPGTRRVELLVDDGGNGIAEDHADWLEPGFAR